VTLIPLEQSLKWLEIETPFPKDRLWGIQWSRDDVTWPKKGKTCDPNTLRAQYLEKQLEMLFSNNR